jgi:hypothetical protein
MPHPKYVLILMVAIALTLFPLLVFFRVLKNDDTITMLSAPTLVTIALLYKFWYEKQMKP